MIVSMDAGDRGDLYDADGVLIQRATWANTETGEVYVWMFAPLGHPGWWDEHGNTVPTARVLQRFRAPLRFVSRLPSGLAGPPPRQ